MLAHQSKLSSNADIRLCVVCRLPPVSRVGGRTHPATGVATIVRSGFSDCHTAGRIGALCRRIGLPASDEIASMVSPRLPRLRPRWISVDHPSTWLFSFSQVRSRQPANQRPLAEDQPPPVSAVCFCQLVADGAKTVGALAIARITPSNRPFCDTSYCCVRSG